MPAYDAFIFDIDGTLLDTLPDLTAVTNTVLASYGFPQHPASEILHFVGKGGRRLIEKAVPAGTSPDVVDEAFKRWQGVHEEMGIRLTKEYDGITEALTALKEQGIKLAALSNKFDGGVQEIVPHFFPGLFEVQHGECDRIPRKPRSDRPAAHHGGVGRHSGAHRVRGRLEGRYGGSACGRDVRARCFVGISKQGRAPGGQGGPDYRRACKLA